MSESSIARWNAIPLVRQDALKRERQEDDMVEDDGDDDIPIVSRSPSPVNEVMDIDHENSISSYDEFVNKPIRETITVDTKIQSSNKGFALLAKMGWSEGQPLGLSGDGRVDPIPFEVKQDTLGIGRASQENIIAAEAVSSRRGLDSERQIQETDEQRRAREDEAARKAAVQDEISNTLRAFYCLLCDKQFQTVTQYDEHTNSYAHHHKARYKDMQANARIKPQAEVDKRKEKERKREERELRKIAAAAGIKMPKPTGSQAGLAPVASATDASSAEPNTSDIKKGGWTSVGSAPSSMPSASVPGFRKSGWTTIDSSSSMSPSIRPPTPPLPQLRSSDWAPVSSATPPFTATSSNSTSFSPKCHTGHIPSFRTGGWTSLDTSTTATVNPPPTSPPIAIPATAPITTPQPPPLSSSNIHHVQPTIGSVWTPTSDHHPTTAAIVPPVSISTSPHAPPPYHDHPSQFQALTPNPASLTSAVSLSKSEPNTGSTEPKRTGWQKFQAKNSKRK